MGGKNIGGEGNDRKIDHSLIRFKNLSPYFVHCCQMIDCMTSADEHQPRL